MESQSKPRIPIRYIIFGGFIILLILAVFLISGATQNNGKLVINVIPADSSIKVDGISTTKNTVSVKPGRHKVTASRTGFKDSVVYVTVAKRETKSAYLAPAPDSPSAYQYLKNNPEIQKEREGYGSANNAQIQDTLQANYPIIKYLPYESANITISYGVSAQFPDDPGRIAIYIITAPENRDVALGWIKNLGFNPNDYEIVYRAP